MILKILKNLKINHQPARAFLYPIKFISGFP